jgi:hypothetical protein
MNSSLPGPLKSQHLPTQTKGVPAWAPFTHRTFAIIWLATVVSNIGAWVAHRPLFEPVMTIALPGRINLSAFWIVNTVPLRLMSAYLLNVALGICKDSAARDKPPTSTTRTKARIACMWSMARLL